MQNEIIQIERYNCCLLFFFFRSMPSCIGESIIAQLVSRRTFGIHYAYAVSNLDTSISVCFSVSSV